MAKPWAALAGVACAVLALPAVAASRATVALELIPTKHTILVDEPLVVTLVVTGKGEAVLDGSAGGIHTVIESAGGSRVYKRKQFVSTWSDPPRATVLGREPLLWDIVVGFDATSDDWACPAAGRCRITVVHGDTGDPDARSNTVEIDVREPQGAEAEAHDALRPFRNTALAATVNEQGMSRELEPLAGRYAGSAYFYLPRAYGLYERLHHAARGVDPYSVDRARQGDVVDAARRQELARRYYAALKPAVAELAETRGPLQPDLLLHLAGVERALGDLRGEKAILRRVAHAFPRRPAGQQARRELKSLAEDERTRRELER